MKKASIAFLFIICTLPSLAQEMFKTADSVRKYRNVPGLVYAVFTTDSVLEIAASGNKKLRVKDPVTLQHRFQIGGSTTIFTTYIAARMVKEGKLSWNSTIVKVFPELDGKIMKLYNKITLQQLLGGRAGLPAYEDFKEWRDIHSLPGSPTQQRVFFTTMMLKKKPALILDSSQAVHSVASVAIAAAMLEKVGKKSWEQLVEQYINKGLNIKAEFDFPALKDTSQPWGHWDNYYALTAHIDDYWARFFPPIAPAGNINISIGDYIVFLRDYMNSLREQKSVIGTGAAQKVMFDKPEYSIGWFNTKWRNNNIGFISGRGGLFSSYVEVIKEKNIGIIVLCNSGSVDGRSAASNLAKLLRHHYATQ
ncbi:MAG: beta-lactamase family protein [Chitinophagaceae bacterium]|nr:beta-lactamase family protein [Chitinophagaceae bacterium]